MADHSDSDSSPKSSSSSPFARRRSPPRARAHSDESGSILIELPSQEAQSPRADCDGSVLVNLPADDATSGETFKDAPDDLTTAGSLFAHSLDESIAVIDFPDESSATAECHKYKEEREMFAHMIFFWCMAELQQKSDAFQAVEGRVEELKMLIGEKSNEHEKCLDELRETYNAWEATKASIEQLNEANTALTFVQVSLSLKDGVLQRIEEVMSKASFPEDLLSLEMTNWLEWLVEQKKIVDMIFSEHCKVKDIVGSIDFPHSVLTGELDSQITWLVNS